ncbi:MULTISPECIES: carbohydrate ABC transporter permease [unclassified Fusibacter]|uniref:carbohydrate ABC transporter permease n=1 Tax=unclassified Fusibacter TaxID=2624464 RepID=UPI0010133835|nr:MULTISPECIES: sugar ABC transporter permease [unclassified Fusibacter]MCK8060469.1 sugar ABC transporter permease [Fusibacter sp. A2]NPE20242.1 sugar ABC transporter permease [Fusibacter sp. A1]RXV63449.1 sugar ABC transporter permease [Fusibacter sp. A1]
MNRYTKDKLIFWLFLAPALLSFLLVVIVPFFMGLYYSFTDWTAVAGETPNFLGFANYANMFSDIAFRYSFLRTFLFTLLSVISINFISLTFAFLVTREIKFKNFYRAGFFIPNLIGGLVLGYIWQFIFKSVVPAIGGLLGIDFIEQLLILAEPNLTLFGLIFAFTWQYAGYIMMIYIAALLNVPQELLEASEIDGANFLQKLWNITIPMIAQAFTITSFLTLVNSFKQYDIIIALTNGGPADIYQDHIVNSTELLAVHIYNVAFKYNNMAEGQARAIVFFIVLSFVSIGQVYFSKKREVEM